MEVSEYEVSGACDVGDLAMSYYFTMTDRATLVASLLQDYADNPMEGARVYRRAIASGVSGIADSPDVHVNLALYLMTLGESVEAEATFRKALGLAPEHIASLYNLGYLIYTAHRTSEAAAIFRQVLALDSAHVNSMINLANSLQSLMQRDLAQGLMRQAQLLAPDNYLPASFELFEATYDASSTDATIFAKAKHAADLRCTGFQAPVQMLIKKPWRQGERPLQVGFVSGDFKTHPVGFFLQGWLPHVDRSRLTLHAFSMQEVDDVVSQEVRPQFETWHAIARMSDEQVQALTDKLGIDVLIDLSGHTDMNRLPLFARRAAPVQISWLGWYATTGVVNMDYFLTDRISSPESSTAQHSERLLYLPDTRLCLCQPIFAPDVSSLPALQNKHITFGSLQSLLKITDATLHLWRQVLERIPSAHLHIRCAQFAQSEMLALFKQRLEDFDFPLARIELLPPVSYAAYLESYQSIDLILDTIPFSGGTTTAEALWMGVPTLTLLGHTLIARQGASLMSAAGLGEWVADSQEDYIAKALYWSEHIEALAELRSNLRDKVRASPLFDAPRFARAFTDALEVAASA
jgi:protein O-GlcNAc transferase